MKENAEKFRALDQAELDKTLREGAEQMFRLRFQLSMGQMDGVKKLRMLRKERARILTVMKQKGVAPSAAGAAALVTKSSPKAAAKTAPKKAAKAVGKTPAVKAAATKTAVPKTVAPKAKPMKTRKGV